MLLLPVKISYFTIFQKWPRSFWDKTLVLCTL